MRRIYYRFLSAFILNKDKRRAFRRRHLRAWGRANRLLITDIHGNTREYPIWHYIAGLEVEVAGNDNLIVLKEPLAFENCYLSMKGNGNRF